MLPVAVELNRDLYHVLTTLEKKTCWWSVWFVTYAQNNSLIYSLLLET